MTTPTQKRPRTRKRTARIGLLGLGTVGRGLVRLLDRRDDFEVTRTLRRSTEPRPFLDGDYDVVVEALGGVEPAATYVRHFLRRGIPVVTANKALVAERGEELESYGTPFRYEAAVAAGIPLLSLLERSLQSTAVGEVIGILNGTSNFILTRVARGLSPKEALEAARREGFVEADPSLDLNGTDAAQKLAVLVRRLGGPRIDIETDTIGGVSPKDCADAASLGYAIKPVAWSDLRSGWVAPALVPLDGPLARIHDEQNGVLLRGEPVGELFLAGPGAGALPTAASILDDLLALQRGEFSGPPRVARPRPPKRHRWFFFVACKVEPPGLDGLGLAERRGPALVTTKPEAFARCLDSLRAVSRWRAYREIV